ncbi:hypothetical protein TNCT_262811 [Trichonephila clavata]|uniref:Uncharacterized protein n=1 Tax=Trichonephila clavata TaxID=2740835 RepID=A0A8X6KJZ9_TRICU|nr:hypothetical protein TNCT_262811 [Trichonephila clavata]
MLELTKSSEREGFVDMTIENVQNLLAVKESGKGNLVRMTSENVSQTDSDDDMFGENCKVNLILYYIALGRLELTPDIKD